MVNGVVSGLPIYRCTRPQQSGSEPAGTGWGRYVGVGLAGAVDGRRRLWLLVLEARWAVQREVGVWPRQRVSGPARSAPKSGRRPVRMLEGAGRTSAELVRRLRPSIASWSWKTAVALFRRNKEEWLLLRDNLFKICFVQCV